MEQLTLTQENGIATITLNRGKVNAINEALTDELSRCFGRLAQDADVRAVILAGNEKFFSFGFDIPELYPYDPADFTRFLRKYCALCMEMFTFPKPLVGALTGHAVAGGCLLALACDERVMAQGKAKIALNEINLGVSIFAGAVAMLRYCAGDRTAQRVLTGGDMMTADEALGLGLIDEAVPAGDVMAAALRRAGVLAGKAPAAYAHLKEQLRQPVAAAVRQCEDDSIARFITLWYAPATRTILQGVTISG